MPKDGSTKNRGALLRRALVSALLLAALGTGAVSALALENISAPAADEMDRAFAVQVVAMTDEISSILRDWSETATPNATASDNMNLRGVGANLSTRSRFWYDTLGAMPVSGNFTDAKQSMLLGLKEFEQAGNSTVQGMDLLLAGNDAASVPLIIEAGDHVSRGGDYFATAQKQFPSRGGSSTATGTRGSTRSWGKQYAVGNPGSYLGTRSGSGTAPSVPGRSRAVASTGTVLKPGSRSYGVAPPAGSFVRWYPGARWAAGIR